MSDSSDKEVHGTLSFGREESENGEHTMSEDTDGEGAEWDGVVEGVIEEDRVVAHKGKVEQQSVDLSQAQYEAMQAEYVKLVAVTDCLLALPQTPKVGSSNQGGSSASSDVLVVFALAEIDVPVGVPLLKKNRMTKAEIEELGANYCILPSVSLRLPTSADIVRYPHEGSVLIFTDMYKHAFRLPFHPWVQKMLSPLGYAPWQ